MCRVEGGRKMSEFIQMCLEMVLQASPGVVVLALLGYIAKVQNRRGEKREEEKKKGIIRTKYRVKTEKIIIIICVVGTIFFSTCMTICIIEREVLWVIGVCGIMALIGVFGTLNTMMWRLEINGDEITWRSTFGRKRRFLFEDITYCERKKGSVRVYVNGKKLFTIDNNIDDSEFMEDIKRRKIPVKSHYVIQLKKKTMKEQEMKKKRIKQMNQMKKK